MTVQVEFWQLVVLLVSFFGGVAGFGKLLLGQFDRRITERLALVDRDLEGLQRNINELSRALPNEYVRREDWIRFSATIDAKMDTLNKKLDGLLERIYARG